MASGLLFSFQSLTESDELECDELDTLPLDEPHELDATATTSSSPNDLPDVEHGLHLHKKKIKLGLLSSHCETCSRGLPVRGCPEALC